VLIFCDCNDADDGIDGGHGCYCTALGDCSVRCNCTAFSVLQNSRTWSLEGRKRYIVLRRVQSIRGFNK